jgi:basic amino acid/polyamine antiporter, APA family
MREMDDLGSGTGGGPTLRKGVGLWGVVMLGAGTAIGVSILTVLQPAAAIAGSGLLIAVGLAALPMIVFALVYAFMSSALPRSGASFDWPSRFVHPLVGFLVAWLRILGSVAALVVLATVLVSYLQMSGAPWLAAIPRGALMALIVSAIFLVNLLGVSVAARGQLLLMLILLGALGIYAGASLPVLSLERIEPLGAQGWLAIAAAVPLMITLFLGIETATEIGEEVRDARRTIPRGITIAIMLTAAVYLLVALVTLGVLGSQVLAEAEAPLLQAAQVGMAGLAVPIILTAATVAILGTMNAIVLIFSRYLFAMGRSGVLPAAFGRVHGRFGTPHIALLAGYGGVMAALLLPSNLIFLLLAVNIPTMLKYLATCLAAIGLVRHHPDLHARALIQWRRGRVELLAMVGIAAALLIILAGLGADWRPYLLVLGWGGAGLLYWAIRRPADPRRVAEPAE